MIFLRQKYKEKPRQYGPASEVQSSVFKNAESKGIDPTLVGRVLPFWEGGGSVAYDYVSKSPMTIYNGAPFVGNVWYCRGYSYDYDRLLVSAVDGLFLNSASICFGCYTGPLGGTGSPGEVAWDDWLTFKVGGGSNELVLECKGSDGKMAFYNVNSHSNVSSIDGGTPVYTSTYRDTALVFDGVNAKIITDGKYEVSAASTSDSTIDAMLIGNRFSGLAYRTIIAKYFYFYVFKTPLTKMQTSLICDNPYFLLNRVAPVFYSIPQTVSFKPFWASQATRISL